MFDNSLAGAFSLPVEIGKQELRLYVAGSTPQSSRAITNLKAICETHLKDRYELTVVDLYEHMECAEDDHIETFDEAQHALREPLGMLDGQVLV